MSNSSTMQSVRRTATQTTLEDLLVRTDVDSRLRTYRSWAALALFLLIPLDMVTTALAVRQFGIEATANPVVTLLLEQGWFVFLGAQVLGVAVVGAILALVLAVIKHTSDPLQGQLALVFEVWIGAMVSLGLFLFVNNFAAIVFQTSLL